MTHSHPFHDRLDLKLNALEFTAPECGAINLRTKKPEYCEFECPMIALRGTPEHPLPHWITDPNAVASRELELFKANLQPADKPDIPMPGVKVEPALS